jgi:predicted nucleic acid-binding protein
MCDAAGSAFGHRRFQHLYFRVSVLREASATTLECAVEAGSECIVTGDADLLRLGQYSGIRIVNVAALLDIVGQ